MEFVTDTPAIEEERVRDWTIGSGVEGKNEVIEEVLGFLGDKIALSPSTLFRYRLCLDEALTNAVTHGCPKDDSEVKVDLHYSAGSWVVRICDDGPGFSSMLVPDPNAPGNQFAESGRGILILERYCDTLVYSQGGREVTFRMKLEEQVV